jgi:hypothetical protein
LGDVVPQRWFTGNAFEVGRQWIARVARDHSSHRLVGEGVRIGSFELSSDGMQITDWIEKL